MTATTIPEVRVSPAVDGRPRALGKFLHAGGEKLYLRGVTYGTFRAGADGFEFPPPEIVADDFAAMAESGINSVRTYTVPPRWLLDLAAAHGLLVLVGLPWEQHVAFLDGRSRRRSIEQRVREGVRACAGHPAVLGYAVGNEIPASIVRWYGRRRIERFLERLCRAAKEEDPEGLVTYVNYPSTEYLQLPFCDLVCFNVYLEEEEQLEAYFARLQNIAENRPLLVTELGLDSRRHGPEVQATVLAWQVRTAFAAGCAGTFVFAWTDEWHRGGHDIDDWEFGLVTAARDPKPALAAVRDAFEDVPFRHDLEWPRVSVVVCTHNGSATLPQCIRGILALDYPDFEVIVVDDGSTDATAEIAAGFDVQLLRTPHRGLSHARNVGARAATGEIVAYLDDDAWPDPHWLQYLAVTFLRAPYAGVGGPNIAPPGSGFAGECVDKAPGGPVHVLLTDREAEHIPGCNMAFRKEHLDAVGGFDEQFWVAGDDVDFCWRLQAEGFRLGFSPAAMVWHWPRRSIRAYFRQQRGYGASEALLERKWPERYNHGGHLRWAGRVYQPLLRALGRSRFRIYYGTWGSGLFQSLYQPSPGLLASLPLMPEWYLLIALFLLMSLYGFLLAPLAFSLPVLDVPFALLLFVAATAALVLQASRTAAASFAGFHGPRRALVARTAVTAFLAIVQPLARLSGRVRHGLTPWRRRGRLRLVLPIPRTRIVWSEEWQSPNERLRTIEAELRARELAVVRGGDFDRWDIHLRVGVLGGARLRAVVEEHGQGRQLVRYRVWARPSRGAAFVVTALAALLGVAAVHAVVGSIVLLGVGLAWLAARALGESATAVAAALAVIDRARAEAEADDVVATLEKRLGRALEGVEGAEA